VDRAILTAAGVLALAGQASALTHIVPTDFATIQGAIDASADGDTVLVLPGTYAEHDIDFGGRAIVVRGSAPADPRVVAATVVDGAAQGTVFWFRSYEDTTSVLEGLTITGGFAEIGPESRGGGITCRPSTGPLIRRCHLRGNVSQGHGGGMACFLAAPVIEECRIENNSATDEGGGVMCDWSSVSIRRCWLGGNRAWNGGALGAFWESSVELVDCVIADNVADYYGGGISATFESSLALTRCTVRDNSAERGGGAGGYDSSAMLQECEIASNAARSGGGLYGLSGTFTSSRFNDNHAEEDGGAYAGSGGLTMSECWFEGNVAGDYGGRSLPMVGRFGWAPAS